MGLVPFSPPPGINSDDTTFSAEGRWAAGSNVRFRDGKPQTVGAALANGPTLTFSSACYDLFAFTRSGVETFVFGGYGTAGPLNVGSLVSVADRSPSPNASTIGWCFAAWGNTLLAQARNGKLYEQSGSGAATEVTQAPAQSTYMIVTPERQVLVFGTKEEISGTFNGLCIRGSDLEDYTDWTTTATNNAFEHILDGPGVIVTARQLGPYVLVWTTTALFLGQFIGDPSQTYHFDRVADCVRPLSPRSVAVFQGTAYWIGLDHQLHAFAPGAPVQTIPCPIFTEFKTNCLIKVNSEKAHLSTRSSFGELWFYYRDARDAVTVNSRFVAYSLGESALARRPVWFMGTHAYDGIIDSEIVRTAHGAVFNETSSLLAIQEPEATTYILEDSDTTFTGAYIQSADFYIDESQRRWLIRRFTPDFETQTGNVALTLFARDRPRSTAVTKGPYTIANTDTKKDFRASGVIFAAKLASSTTAFWRLGKSLFDMVPTGER